MMICAHQSISSRYAARQTPLHTARCPRVTARTGLCHGKVAEPAGAQVSCSASAGSVSNSSGSPNQDSHAGYAILHDFCMTLPYGTISLLAGIVCFFLAPPLKLLAMPLTGLGAAMLVLAVASLKVWKQGKSSTPVTLMSAGVASGMAYLCVPSVQGGLVGWVAGILAGLSAAAALFCLYNVLAGGNPPRKGSH